MDFKISGKLIGMEDDDLVIFLFDDFLYFKYCIEVTGSLVSDFGMSGVIVLINKEVSIFVNELKRNNIVYDDLWFVDCVSLISGMDQPSIKNCMTVSHPRNFQEILLRASQAMSNIAKNKKFIIFISPHALIHYADVNELGLFFNDVKNFFKQRSIFDGISIEKEGDPIFENIARRIADKVIEI